MPAIKPLSEFIRNQNAVIEQLSSSHEPLYLTRNGSASVVVMDASAFDDLLAFRDEAREREMRIARSLARGWGGYCSGDAVSAEDADAAIRAAKGW